MALARALLRLVGSCRRTALPCLELRPAGPLGGGDGSPAGGRELASLAAAAASRAARAAAITGAGNEGLDAGDFRSEFLEARLSAEAG